MRKFVCNISYKLFLCNRENIMMYILKSMYKFPFYHYIKFYNHQWCQKDVLFARCMVCTLLPCRQQVIKASLPFLVTIFPANTPACICLANCKLKGINHISIYFLLFLFINYNTIYSNAISISYL